jgi:hypothetical protein
MKGVETAKERDIYSSPWRRMVIALCIKLLSSNETVVDTKYVCTKGKLWQPINQTRYAETENIREKKFVVKALVINRRRMEDNIKVQAEVCCFVISCRDAVGSDVFANHVASIFTLNPLHAVL